MYQVFVSYSRDDLAFVKEFVELFRETFPDVKVWYDQANLRGGEKWWDAIRKGIAGSDIFIYILSDDSINSPFCQAEFAEARRLHKRIITIRARPNIKLTDILRSIQFVDMKNGPDAKSVARLTAAVNKHLTWTNKLRSIVMRLLFSWLPSTPHPESKDRWARRLQLFLRVGLLAVIVMVLGYILLFSWREGTEQANATNTAVAIISTYNFVSTRDASSTLMAQTQSAAATMTADTWTDTPTIAPTSTYTPTPPATLLPGELARTPLANNSGWTPVEQDFDGVMMVMVPAGCFTMGSRDNEAYPNEKEAHRICFDEPFWIDKTEVTNSQFEILNQFIDMFWRNEVGDSTWADDNRPRENITWVKAREFCEKRGMRLPTEAEWEFAARGPDNLLYPWGSEFSVNNVVNTVYAGNSRNQSAVVGSKPGDKSWVGALDMSGNVREWVNSLYKSYPYTPDDRERDATDEGWRVIRGGSWRTNFNDMRAAVRTRQAPDYKSGEIGFRCARSF